MKTILFQGDSITDAGRTRETDEYLGEGYPQLVKAALGYENPGEYQFINRGVSGNRIVDLYARIKIDIINVKPDIMSILIGVNDVWHEYMCDNGIDAEKYFKFYCMLIEEVRESLPDVKIMILEPFVLRGTATEENWSGFETKVAEMAVKAKMVAEKYNLPFVPLQQKLDDACRLCPSDYWLADGVHPTVIGHELIKREWLKAFEKLAK